MRLPWSPHWTTTSLPMSVWSTSRIPIDMTRRCGLAASFSSAFAADEVVVEPHRAVPAHLERRAHARAPVGGVDAARDVERRVEAAAPDELHVAGVEVGGA